MLTIAEYLSARGHRVIVLTGSRFAQRVVDQGLEFRPLSGNADFDDRDTASYLPDREKYSGLAQAQYDIQTIFVKTIPAQYREVAAIVAAEKPDAILVDGVFAGVSPIVFEPKNTRIPVIAIGVTPLSQSSRDVGPYGMAMAPSSSPLGRIRNRSLNALAKNVLFRRTQLVATAALAEVSDKPLRHFIMDASSMFDRYLQLSSTDFEYPRSDLAPNTRFVGPVIPPARFVDVPAWWPDLSDGRPIVHVTQGTIDNHDFGRLVRPTIEALENTDNLVVVSLGGAPLDSLGPVPGNVRVAEFLPYDELLPRTDAFVTNGGFGGVQHALSHGVPIVIAGDSEDKPEVAARVAWSKAGINLRTGTPSAKDIGEAVDTVLSDPLYRVRAKRLAMSIAKYTPLETIEEELETAIARNTGVRDIPSA
jgi:MGT family glycosyltransferase